MLMIPKVVRIDLIIRRKYNDMRNNPQIFFFFDFEEKNFKKWISTKR